MARVIIVRHCESEANRGGPEAGGSNSPLSARGRLQAQAVRSQVAALELASPVLMSSPLVRAADTAQAIDTALGVGVHFDARLSAGESVMARAMDLMAPETVRTVGKEVMDAVAERLGHGAETLILVAHRYTIWALLSAVLGDAETAKAVQLKNGDQLEFHLERGRLAGPLTHRPLEVAGV